MSKLASYPFMNIANKYGYPYADVLIFADSLRMMNGVIEKQHQEKWGPRQIAAREIWYAIKEFRSIQRGEIDWNTGEPRAEERSEWDRKLTCAYREGEAVAYNEAHKIMKAELQRLRNLLQNGSLTQADFGDDLPY